MKIGEQWMKWAIFEAMTGVILRTLQKVLGLERQAPHFAVIAVTGIGFIQTILGIIGCRARKISLTGNISQNLTMALFGLFAYIGTVLGILVFVYNGDLGTSSFILTLSIVPGAIIDRIFFRHKLTLHQYIGLLLTLLAAYVILGMPDLKAFTSLPLWIWLSIAAMLLRAVNQALTQSIKDADPLVKNFWGGLVMSIGGIITIIVMKYSSFIFDIGTIFWTVVVISGILSALLWAFNLLSYHQGGTIVLKKFVMESSYLIMTMTVGILFFGEPLTIYKISGLIIFMIAFVFFDKNTWSAVRNGFKPKYRS